MQSTHEHTAINELLALLDDAAAVVGKDGRVVAVNSAWRARSKHAGPVVPSPADVKDPRVLLQSVGCAGESLDGILAGMATVLRGDVNEHVSICDMHEATLHVSRKFMVSRLDSVGGAVISYRDEGVECEDVYSANVSSVRARDLLGLWEWDGESRTLVLDRTAKSMFCSQEVDAAFRQWIVRLESVSLKNPDVVVGRQQNISDSWSSSYRFLNERNEDMELLVKCHGVKRCDDDSHFRLAGAVSVARSVDDAATDAIATSSEDAEMALEVTRRELLNAVHHMQEQEVQLLLLKDIAETSAKISSLAEMIDFCVTAISRYMNWIFGHAYVVDEHGGALVGSGAWYATDWERFKRLIEITAVIHYARNVGGVGSAFESKRPVLYDPSLNIEIPERQEAMHHAGLAWGVAIPIVVRSKVVAVLEFYSEKKEYIGSAEHEFLKQLAVQLNVIAESKCDEQELREREEEISTVIKNTADAVITFDERGYVRSFNPAAESIFGYAGEEAVGMSVSELMPGHFAIRGNEKNKYNHGEKLSRFVGHERELDGVRKDGALFPIEMSLNEYTLRGRKYFTGIMRDITERREVMAQLTTAKELAEEASKTKSLFLASMSHEIRTPMNGVIGMIDLLAHTSLDQNQNQMVETIKGSAFSLLGIIDDILDFSKIEAGKLSLEYLSVNLRELIEGVAGTMQPVALKHGVCLYVYCDPLIPNFVYADPVRLRQILYNLASNAVKFTSKVKRVNKSVTLKAELRDDQGERVKIRFSVADNGIGISPEAQKTLFKPFCQAERSTTRRFGGTGLGLSICYRLTEMMEGTIILNSAPDEGSTFTVELPMFVDKDGECAVAPKPLSGVAVVYYGDGELRDIVCSYLQWAGANIRKITTCMQTGDLTPLTSNNIGLTAIVVDMAEVAESAYKVIMSRHRGSTLVRLERGRRSSPRWRGDKELQLDANAMRHDALILAVSAAVGGAEIERRSYSRSSGEAVTTNTAIPPTVEDARNNGQLILLAEDSETNQNVIMRQLNLLGYAAEVASDGEEALAMFMRGGYALLLTDYHMPKMDGVELAKAVRRHEHGTSSRTPIVAITANAVKGEKQRMLSFGMDDYVTKPIVLDDMRSMLSKWLPVNDVVASVAAVKKPGKERTVKDGTHAGTLSLPPVDVRALRDIVGDDDDVINEFLWDFVVNAQLDVAFITSASSKGAREEVAGAAHKLKSAARTVGANSLADVCFELEKAGRSTTDIPLDKLVAQLAEEFDTAKVYINTALL